jgi:hypothetical protein
MGGAGDFLDTLYICGPRTGGSRNWYRRTQVLCCQQCKTDDIYLTGHMLDLIFRRQTGQVFLVFLHCSKQTRW